MSIRTKLTDGEIDCEFDDGEYSLTWPTGEWLVAHPNGKITVGISPRGDTQPYQTTIAGLRAPPSTSTDDARAALFHLEVFADGEDSKRIRVVINALSRLTAIEQAAQKVLDDIDDCRSANSSVAALRTALATSRSQHEGASS